MIRPPADRPDDILKWVQANPAAPRKTLIDLFRAVNDKIDQIEDARDFDTVVCAGWLQPWYALCDILDPGDRLTWPRPDLSILDELEPDNINQMELF